jgi:hypothetical protein
MSIRIERLEQVDGGARAAVIRHGENELQVHISGDEAKLARLVGTECITEMSVERVSSWKTLPDFVDEQSGIQSLGNAIGAAIIRGRVHNLVPADDGIIIDIYLQTGAEFIAVSSRALGESMPELNAGVELHVDGLCVYPSGA